MNELFPAESWKRIRDTYEAWWKRELDRPVIYLAFIDENCEIPQPELDPNYLLSVYNDEPAEKVLDMLEYLMRSKRYECDGYPYVWMYFGPMSTIEHFGAKATVLKDTVWYEPKENIPMPDLNLRIDPNSVFNRRFDEISKIIDERFPDGYVSASPMGGSSSLDILTGYLIQPSYSCLSMIIRRTLSA